MIYLGSNPGQQVNKNIGNSSHEVPLIPQGTVVLGENSVFYKHSTIDAPPAQLATEKPSEQIED